MLNFLHMRRHAKVMSLLMVYTFSVEEYRQDIKPLQNKAILMNYILVELIKLLLMSADL